MQVTSEQLNPCTIQLAIVCAPEEVKEGFTKAFKSISKSMKIPGFRPGHAPRAMVESLISQDSLHSEAADQIVRSVLMKALKQEDLQPFPGNRPSVNLRNLTVTRMLASSPRKSLLLLRWSLASTRS